VFLAALLIAGPFSTGGLVDDWSYARTAEILARTGHVVYNGWAAPMLGWQLYLGAAFVRLFGDSMTSIRLSTMAVSLVTVGLFELWLEAAGVTRRNAIFGTLTLCLSPIFMPYAASFMTDTNSVFVVVLCVFLCQRALAAPDDRSAALWLLLAAVTNALGGTVRQTAWLPGLLVVPAAAWLMRRRRPVLAAGVAGWVLVAATMAGFMVWWAHRPFAVQDALIVPGRWLYFVSGRGMLGAAGLLIGSVLCCVYLMFPILAAGLARIGGWPRWALAGVVLCGIVLVPLSRSQPGLLAPWLNDVLGLVEGQTAETAGRWIDWTAWLGVASISFAAALAAVAFAVAVRRQAPGGDSGPVGAGRSWSELRILYLPYLLVYSGLMATRFYDDNFCGRYLLGFAPFLILLLLRLYQDRVASRLPGIAYAALALMAVAAVTGTHDWYAWARAMERAQSELVARGISPLNISGAPELEGQTQLDAVGYIDEPRMKLPAWAYVRNDHAMDLPYACQTWLTQRAPAIHPRYVIRDGAKACIPGAPIEVHSFPIWRPPFRREYSVMKVPGR
jgi:hypothetical protein